MLRGASVAHLAGGRKIYHPMQRRMNSDGTVSTFRVLKLPKSE